MSILIIFGIGIAAGLIAAFPGGPGKRLFFFHVLIGIVGAMVGGILVARLLDDKAYRANHFDAEAIAWATGGAVLFLALARLLAGLATDRPS
jgi:uncharacterized membrane protein YeaQ/YmgE (transglycosylase-associated protein family)